jgi:hypothetical protein
MMKFVLLTLLLSPAVLMAQDIDDSLVHWDQIVGVITAPAINNPAGGIAAGAGPWSVRSGQAHVNLATGQAAFEVRGLVLNGSNASGTPGPVGSVVGTLVCNPGSNAQTIHDSAEVRLSARGDARFNGDISGLPGVCANPLFLVRIGPSFPVPGAVGRWLATGAVRVTGDRD